jgi:hypothetical protein
MTLHIYTVALTDLCTYHIKVAALAPGDAEMIARELLHRTELSEGTGITDRTTDATVSLDDPQPPNRYDVHFTYAMNHVATIHAPNARTAERMAKDAIREIGPFEFDSTDTDVYDVESTDLILRGYGEGDVDFLREPVSRAKHVVTNPPYGRGLGDAFVYKALELTAKTGGSVAMLLNLASLCHPTRHDLWTSHPPAVIYALDELICWPEGRPELARASTATHRYCWVVWKPGHTERPAFWWLSTGTFGGTATGMGGP